MPNTKNSAINLSVINNTDGFTLSGTAPGGRALSVTSGNITLQGGGIINNGQILIGNSGTNSMDVGVFSAGSGISITNGAASVTINIQNDYDQMILSNRIFN